MLGPQWNALGPAPTFNGQTQGLANEPVVGAVNQVLPFGSAPNTFFVATANGGVWRSTNVDNAIPSWTPPDRQPGLPFHRINRVRPLYVGIGTSSSGANDGGPLTGLLRTADALDATPTFASLGGSTLSGDSINFLQVSRRTTSDGAVILAGSPDGLFLSENDGKTFKLVSGSGNLPAGALTDLIIDSSGGADKISAAVADAGVFSSADRKTWASENRNFTASQLGTFDVIRLALHTGAATKVLHAAEVTGTTLANVYNSVDGANWNAIGAAPAINPGGQGNTGDLSLAVRRR